ncbi:MAG TPA: pyridoxal-phosphate dependent enzyme, partial [Chloroflexota bacterium]
SYEALLPGPSGTARPTLGESDTPLLHLERLSEELQLPGLRCKYEGSNPTHSYKDRFQAVSVAHASALGCPGCFCASTGNHGIAAAAYCALAGLACAVFAHPEAPDELCDHMRALGARVEVLPAAVRDAAMHELLRAGWYPATTSSFAPLASPFGITGYKTIAYELCRQCGGEAPGWVLCPVGGGDGLAGVWQGFLDLAQLGVIQRLPRMVACQATGADPVVRAFTAGLDEPPVLDAVSSIALSIRDPSSGEHVLAALRASGGMAVAVEDEEIVAAASLLASCGLLVDPASAAPLAVARRLATSIGEETAVCLLTATGGRWPALRQALRARAKGAS